MSRTVWTGLAGMILSGSASAAFLASGIGSALNIAECDVANVGTKPVIFLINNGGYTIERGYLGKAEPYNDIANWAYADLPKVFRPDTSARSFVVRTVSDLKNVLSTPNHTMIFVESIMDPYDAPAAVIRSSNKGAELDYGPRGPQHRDNVQLRPST